MLNQSIIETCDYFHHLANFIQSQIFLFCCILILMTQNNINSIGQSTYLKISDLARRSVFLQMHLGAPEVFRSRIVLQVGSHLCANRQPQFPPSRFDPPPPRQAPHLDSPHAAANAIKITARPSQLIKISRDVSCSVWVHVLRGACGSDARAISSYLHVCFVCLFSRWQADGETFAGSFSQLNHRVYWNSTGLVATFFYELKFQPFCVVCVLIQTDMNAFCCYADITYSKKKNTGIVTAFTCNFIFFLINSQAASEQQSNRCQVTKQQNGNTVTQ